MRKIAVLLILLQGCILYDRLLVYDKTHKTVETKLLHYNGFYYCNSGVGVNKEKCPETVLPIFFYSDGTAYSSGHFCNIDSVKHFYAKARQFPNYNWGSYRVEENEITVEFYWPNSGTGRYERYHLKGQIYLDTITFSVYTDRNSVTKSINEKYYFEPFEWKPDSSLSFLKLKKRFNK